ncbi:lipoate--protein ligase family protein [Leucothrix mucor]|uniref:lipoate--protein ligase family protein n=1 Tax=Leucothrix mucor TaxID=45248 RepID=UPI0003B31CA6|nr:protein ligase [Leucothrix mucor]
MNTPSRTVNTLVQFTSMADALVREKQLFERVIYDGLDHASFMWSANQCLVVPLKFSHHPAFEDASKASAAAGWPVHVRQTGGGVTPQGPGIINVSLALANSSNTRLSIANGYQLLCQPMITEFKQLGISAYCASVPEAFCDGDYNIVVDGKKMVGTAQRHSRTKGEVTHQAVFAHALILYETDFQEVTKQVNRLYSLMGLKQRFESSAHCSLASVYPRPDVLPSKELFSQRLMQRYQAELCRFGASKDFDECR